MSSVATFVLLGGYLVVLAWLGVAGMRRTKSLEGFAIGNRDMSPALVGVAMASSIASSATFVINPGFVYTDGVSALLHYGVAAQGGVIFGLLAVCKGFRRHGDAQASLTIPDWIRARYGSRGFALFFAVTNLLSIAFIVLILFGCAILVTALTGLTHTAALLAVTVVVLGYVMLGGTYAHAYTNAAQALMMVVVALGLFATGWHHLTEDNLVAQLQRFGPHYAEIVNPDSVLYGDLFAVFVSGFVVTFALMLQPHVLTKVLYLRAERDLRVFLLTAVGTGLAFSLILFVGLYARLGGLEVPIESQDHVVTTYVATVFGESTGGDILTSAVLVALLAAGMSTLDGILVAVSAMVTHDLVLRGRRDPGSSARALKISRIVVVSIGLVAFAVAVDPPPLVGLFAQKGVYGLAAASFVPIVFGVLIRGAIPVVPIATASAVALAVHFSLHLSGFAPNPAVSACYGILASAMVALLALFVWRRFPPARGDR
ncbi:MAG: sodium:solute symporter family protein [Myxococcota bacterium]